MRWGRSRHYENMQQTLILRLLGIAISTTLPVGLAHAMPYVQLNQSVLIRIPAKDVPDFKHFIGQALNTGTAGSPLQWQSTQHARRAPVQVTVTPGAVTATRAAGSCRLLAAQVQQQPRPPESWKVWFCQQPNGSWKISSLG